MSSAKEFSNTRSVRAARSSFGWADLALVALIAILSVPPLLWFAQDWTVGNDAARYLFAGSELVLGRGLQASDGLPFNGGHGPTLPALIGSLILIFGRDIETLAWALRLLALLNPLLAYFLIKRISGPLAGLIAAALVTLFGNMNLALNIDAVLLMVYLLVLLTLLAAINRDSSALAMLSGVLLGVCILTKETAFASLPLAMVAALLLDWGFRGALWHYLGVVVVCLMWWIWLWSASGQVYLADRLPPPLRLPLVVAAAILLGFAALASGMAARFVAAESRRRWTGWLATLAWSVSLSGLVLTTASSKLAGASFESLRLYLAGLLSPSAVIVPVLIVVVGYVVWKARLGEASWRILALALAFQMPICLLVVVEEWAPRQFLVTQTLLMSALAALVVDAGAAALQGQARCARLAGAVVAAPLMILLSVACVERVQALLPDDPSASFERHRAVPHASGMVDWIAANVPEGERILANPAYSSNRFVVFLDGGRHEWTFLRLDQVPCEPRPNIQPRCDPAHNAISRTPPDAVWVQMAGECRVISLSMSNLVEQVRRTHSGYVLITGAYKYPGILELPALLEDSEAFEIVHTELAAADRGAVLLKRTGRVPKGIPTQMDENTLLRLRRCERAKGPDHEQRLRSRFPHGIATVSG